MFKSIKIIFTLLLLLINFTSYADEEKNDYVLGAGDAIHIIVFQNPELTLDIKLPKSGNINYPLIGQINIGGLTIVEAESKIASGLRTGGFFKSPQVNIVMITPGNQISVLGEVTKPGRYALDTKVMRVSDALALAGGAIPGGSDTAVVIGTRNNAPFRKVVDIASIFLDNNKDDNIDVISGDAIYVHRPPMLYIYGEVQKPGSYRVERNMTVIQALADGGGLTPRGTQRNIKLFRRNSAGVNEKTSPKLTDPVQDQDVIFVEESLF